MIQTPQDCVAVVLPPNVNDQFAVIELRDNGTYVITEGMRFPSGGAETKTGHISVTLVNVERMLKYVLDLIGDGFPSTRPQSFGYHHYGRTRAEPSSGYFQCIWSVKMPCVKPRQQAFSLY